MTAPEISAVCDPLPTSSEKNIALYAQKFQRNPFTKIQQERIRAASFALVGLGGTGGFMLENLLRLGAEHFMIFDHDRFELSNFNRQLLATQSSLDSLKTKEALSRAMKINASVQIKYFSEFNSHSAADLKGASIVLDGTDNLETKRTVASVAKTIPYVFCSAQGYRGIVSIFKNYSFHRAFQLEHHHHSYKSCSSVVCPAAAIAGSLAASQAVSYLLGKPYAKAPDAWFFDLSKKDIFWRSKLG